MYRNYTKIPYRCFSYPSKFLLALKLVLVLLFFSLVNVSASSFGQSVTLNGKDITIERVIREIKKQTGYNVLWSDNQADSRFKIEANFNNAPIAEVMEKILSGKGLTYLIEEKTIIVKAKQKSIIDKVANFFINIKITGKVKDNTGQAMPGVVIREKGTNNLVSTNEQGNYQISVKEDAVLVYTFIGYKTQEISIKGKASIDVVLEEDQAQLKEVNIVSTGYQNVDKKLFTGSSSLLKAEDAQRNGVPDVSRMLEGQVAGVSVQNVSGTFGAAPKIRVRGATSLSGDNKPLWVVDGIILEDVVNISNEQLSTGDANTLIGSSVAGLNPDDIESFTILKDAAATAKYGARAMNGVVVINTKKGRVTEGTPKINYTGNFTTYMKPSYSQFDIMTSADQIFVVQEQINKGYFGMGTSRAATGGIIQKMYDQFYDYDEATDTYALNSDIASRNKFLEHYANANTNWFDILFKNSLMQEHSVNITSGTEKFQTYASASYLSDDGQTLGSNVDRITGNLRASFKMGKKITGELMATGSIRKQRTPGTLDRAVDVLYGSFNRDFDINPYSYALNSSRLITAYEDNGELEYFRRNYAPFNILNELENNYIKLKQADFKVQGTLSYKIFSDFKYTVSGAYRYVKTDRQHYIKDNSNMAMAYRAMPDANAVNNNKFLYTNPDDLTKLPTTVLPEGGFYNIKGDYLDTYYFRQDLQYDKKIGKDHHLNLFGSMEVRYADRQIDRFDGVGYQYENAGVAGGLVNPSYLFFKANQESGYPYYAMNYTYDRFAGFLGTLAYAYKNKYAVNSSYRVDGSNKMGKSRAARWLPTWNISGRWTIDEEKFWPENNIVSSAIIRASYGLVGNIGNATNTAAVFYNQITRRRYEVDKETATYISSLANTDLTWEKSKDINLATDIGLLKNRVQLTVEYFKRNIYDLIGTVGTPGIGGQSSKVANYGKMKSSGLEFSLGGNVINNSKFKWRTNLNMAYITNEITDLEAIPILLTLVSPAGGALKGYPQRGLFSLQFAGLDHNYGYPLFIDPTGKVNANINPQTTSVGKLKYEGPIDAPYNGGFYNNFKYKSFSLSALFTFSAGNFVRLDDAFSLYYNDARAMSKDMLNRWIMPGDEKYTNIPAILDNFTATQLITDANGSRIDGRIPYNMYNYSTERVAKGDFIRFKQISFSYEIPQKLASKLQLASASITLVGNNVALLYADERLHGQDPEFFNAGGVSTPVAKQYTLSLKVGF